MTDPSRLKPTTNPRQAWISIVLVLVVSGLFGLLVLPRLGPRQGGQLEGLAAPDFALELISGGEVGNRIRLSNLAGKAVVLDFWASWCGPCREQAPIVDAAFRKHPGGEVVFVGVNTGDQREDALKFVRAHGIGYPIAFDEGDRVAAAYGARALPTMVVIDKHGKISAVRSRVVRAAELDDLVAGALSR